LEKEHIVKSQLIDMGVAVHETLVEIYEVKTSTTRSDLYSAIGQLLVHGSGDGCRRVIVLPAYESIPPDIKRTFDRLSIDRLHFKLGKKSATIFVPN
jgi:hypothetical protein